jgi:hypothetical protein
MNFNALNALNGFKSIEIENWAMKHLAADSTVYSDGLNCFPTVKNAGCEHIPYVTGDGQESVDKAEFI